MLWDGGGRRGPQRDREARAALGAFTRARDRLVFGPAALFARDVLDELHEHPADVVAVDCLLPGAGAAETESWDDPRPLVVAGFISTFMAQRPLAQRVLAALSELPVRGLLTTGPALDPADLPVPGDVVVRRWVPHAAVAGARPALEADAARVAATFEDGAGNAADALEGLARA